jgi:hypothetical protein
MLKADLGGYGDLEMQGFVSLAYSPSRRLLVSAGFDRDLYVWNSLIDTPVGKLSGLKFSILFFLFYLCYFIFFYLYFFNIELVEIWFPY